MIGRRLNAGRAQRRGRRFGVPAGGGVDEHAPLRNEAGEHGVLVVLTRHGPHDEADIGPVEPRHDDEGSMKTEQIDDVGTDSGVAVAVNAAIGGRPGRPSLRRHARAAARSRR